MDSDTYKEILTSIIKKQSAILGMPAAINIAGKLSSITVSPEGGVTGITGDPKGAMSSLVSLYLTLSGQISENALQGVMEQYPKS